MAFCLSYYHNDLKGWPCGDLSDATELMQSTYNFTHLCMHFLKPFALHDTENVGFDWIWLLKSHFFVCSPWLSSTSYTPTNPLLFPGSVQIAIGLVSSAVIDDTNHGVSDADVTINQAVNRCDHQ